MSSPNDGPSQPGRLQAMMDGLFSIPRPWVAVVATVTVASIFEVTWSEEAWRINLRITSTTVVLATIAWLPVFLRMLALLGGSVKAGDNEAQFTGLLPFLKDSLGALASMKRRASQSDIDAFRVDETLREVEDALSQTAPNREAARSELRELAARYEQIRNTMEFGDPRTSQLEKLVAQVRAFARKADLPTSKLREWFSGESSGERIVVLGVLQRMPDGALFDIVLSAIQNSKSAFEQYHALRAAQCMLGRLSDEQKHTLKSLLQEQLSDSSSHIAGSTDRKAASRQILAALDDDT